MEKEKQPERKTKAKGKITQFYIENLHLSPPYNH
jgi:hypothetical protein